MARNFKEKYKSLYDDIKNLQKRQLTSIEARGDDFSSSILKPINDSNLNILTTKTSPNGFVETYCLNEEQAKKLQRIRKTRKF